MLRFHRASFLSILPALTKRSFVSGTDNAKTPTIETLFVEYWQSLSVLRLCEWNSFSKGIHATSRAYKWHCEPRPPPTIHALTRTICPQMVNTSRFLGQTM